MKKTFTKTWKVYAPSLAKKDNTVYWDWSNESDGIRIFESWTKEVTGHNYLVIRITRNTEEECYDELDGQITDGYFENYPYHVNCREMSKKFSPSVREGAAADLKNEYLKEAPEDERFWLNVYQRYQATLSAILTTIPNGRVLIDRLKKVGSDLHQSYTAVHGWGATPDDEKRDKYHGLIETSKEEILSVFDAILARL